MWLLNFIKECQIKRKLRQLSPAERQEILEKSPYEAVPFQGEGYHVFLKSDPDYYTGYVETIGEISPEEAEDWLIRKYWEENRES